MSVSGKQINRLTDTAPLEATYATHHQLPAHNAVGETRKVLDLGRGGELTASGDTVGHETLIENGLQLGAGQVHGGGVGSRPRADDDNLVVHASGCDLGNLSRLLRVLLDAGGNDGGDGETGHACAKKGSAESGRKQFGGIGSEAVFWFACCLASRDG